MEIESSEIYDIKHSLSSISNALWLIAIILILESVP